MKPYYEDSQVTIYHCDCRQILPTLPKVDLVLTDPPYPDYHVDRFRYKDGLLSVIEDLPCRQLIFWSAKVVFPLNYTAIHIWDKKIGSGSQYERIFERHGEYNYKVFGATSPTNIVRASMACDLITGHASQKPIMLIKRLIVWADSPNLILDPFMGSGTTLRAAKDLGRKAIGIELDEHDCEMAATRMEQEILQL